MQIRIFNSSSARELEQTVNEWLTINPDIDILLLTQSESGKFNEDWAVTLTLLYRERDNPTDRHA